MFQVTPLPSRGHDCYTLGVDSAQVGILEKTNQVSLASLLKSHDGRALKPEIGLEILSDFSYRSLEGQLSDEKLPLPSRGFT